MSCFFVFGNFAVAGASRVSSPKKTSKAPGASSVSTSYYLYDTTISLSKAPPVQASLRVYSAPNVTPFPAQTIVFAIASAHAPVNGVVLLDGLCVFPYPGNCDDNSYEDHIPNFPATFACFSGAVRDQTRPLPDDDTSRAFMVDVSDFVRNAAQPTSLQAVFDGSSSRWNKTPNPNPRSPVEVLGHCRAIASDGSLAVTIDKIVFNVGSWTPPDSNTDNGGPPPRRRRLAAYAGGNGAVPSNLTTSNMFTMPSNFSSMSFALPPVNNNPAYNTDMIAFEGDGASGSSTDAANGQLSSSSHVHGRTSPVFMSPQSSSLSDAMLMPANSNTVPSAVFMPTSSSSPLTPIAMSPIMPSTPAPTPNTILGGGNYEERNVPSAKAKGKRRARN